MSVPWKKSCDKPRWCIKKQRYHFAHKGSYNQSYGFSSIIYMWEHVRVGPQGMLSAKTWCIWIVVLEKTLKSPLEYKIKSVHPKGNQPWIFTGRTDAKASILWLSDGKNWLIGKKSWCWERLRAREWGNRGWDGWMTSLTQWTWVCSTWTTCLFNIQDIVKDKEAWCAAVYGITKNWT